MEKTGLVLREPVNHGAFFMLNENHIHHGDCILLMTEIEPHSINMILCDLPYKITNCDYDKKENEIELKKLWEQYKRIIRNNGVIILTACQPFSSELIMSNLNMYKYSWYWVKNKKTGFLNAKKQPLRQVEEILVFYNKQCVYNPQKESGHKPVNSYTKRTFDGKTLGKTKTGISGGGQTERYPSNILYFPVVNNDSSSKNEKRIHPNQKPIALFEYLIKTYTNEEDIVLDNCAGSCTTAIACDNLNRKWICIEKEKEYCEIGNVRIEENRFLKRNIL